MKQRKKTRVERPQDLEAFQKEQRKVAALDKEIAGLRRQDRQPVRKRPKIFVIILLMAAVWGLYGWHQYYRHPLPLWFLVILSAITMTFLSGFLVYSLKKGRTYSASPWGGRGEWIYRDDTPGIYWFCLALLLFYDAAIIYVFCHLLIKGSV